MQVVAPLARGVGSYTPPTDHLFALQAAHSAVQLEVRENEAKQVSCPLVQLPVQPTAQLTVQLAAQSAVQGVIVRDIIFSKIQRCDCRKNDNQTC